MDCLSTYLILRCSTEGPAPCANVAKGKLTSYGNSVPQDDSIRSAVSIQARESHAPRENQGNSPDSWRHLRLAFKWPPPLVRQKIPASDCFPFPGECHFDQLGGKQAKADMAPRPGPI